MTVVVLTERAINHLATRPGLSQAVSLVLWTLVKRLPVNGAPLNLSHLAEELKLTVATVTNAAKQLLAANLLQRGARVGKIYIYTLNPACFHHI